MFYITLAILGEVRKKDTCAILRSGCSVRLLEGARNCQPVETLLLFKLDSSPVGQHFVQQMCLCQPCKPSEGKTWGMR